MRQRTRRGNRRAAWGATRGGRWRRECRRRSPSSGTWPSCRTRGSRRSSRARRAPACRRVRCCSSTTPTAVWSLWSGESSARESPAHAHAHTIACSKHQLITSLLELSYSYEASYEHICIRILYVYMNSTVEYFVPEKAVSNCTVSTQTGPVGVQY